MNKPLYFWMACSALLFVLSLVWLSQGLSRKNMLFTAWLLASVCVQLLGAWALALHRPWWFSMAGSGSAATTLLLAMGALIVAAGRWGCPVNRVIVFGLGGMLAMQCASAILDNAQVVENWTRNLGFFGPAIYMLVSFSNLRLDMLPLWLREIPNSKFNLPEAAAAMARAILS